MSHISDSIAEEVVDKSLTAYEAAKCDTERFASLLVIGKLMSSGIELPLGKQQQIFETVGFNMIYRLLNTREVPSDCPKTIYASVGCSLLSCLCSKSDIISAAQMHTIAPILVNYLSESDDLLVNDTLECLLYYLSKESSHELLLSGNCLEKVGMIYLSNQNLQDKACDFLCQFAVSQGPDMWKDPGLFNEIMVKLSEEFMITQTARKFILCDKASKILLSCPDSDIDNSTWTNNLEKGLGDILFSKIDKEQRDPALKLASRLVELKDLPFNLSSQYACSKFYHLVTRLSCIEIIMILEDNSIQDVAKDAELLISCFCIAEKAFGYLKPTSTVSSKQKEQLYKTFKNTIDKILIFLKDIWKLSKNNLSFHLYSQIISGCIRMIGAWTAHEPFSLRDEVLDCMDALLDLSVMCLDNCNPLQFLLPTLSYFVAEDNFLDYLESNLLSHLCSSLQNQLKKLDKLSENEESEAVSSVVAVSTVLINVMVIHEANVAGNDDLNELTRCLFSEFPYIRDTIEGYLVLCGNLTALGLLLMKTQITQVKKLDMLCCRFLQYALRFLWDAFDVDGARLSVSDSYAPIWKDVMELWFLSTETLKGIIPLYPWVTVFIMESGWLDEILAVFRHAQRDGIESNVKSAFEDLLCCLAQSDSNCFSYLKDNNVLELCKKFELTDLPNYLLQQK